MTHSLTLTARQTAAWDESDNAREDLRARAARRADELGGNVEIYSDDGIVLDVAYPAEKEGA